MEKKKKRNRAVLNLLKECGKSRNAFASYINMANQQLGQYINYHTDPTPETAQRIADGFTDLLGRRVEIKDLKFNVYDRM